MTSIHYVLQNVQSGLFWNGGNPEHANAWVSGEFPSSGGVRIHGKADAERIRDNLLRDFSIRIWDDE